MQQQQQQQKCPKLESRLIGRGLEQQRKRRLEPHVSWHVRKRIIDKPEV